MLTKVTRASFDPEASSYVWDNFLEAVFDGNQDLIDFNRRLMGYGITGDVREHVLPVFYGKGSNGKSTKIEAELWAIGEDYATKAAPNLLMTKRERHSPHRAG